MDAAILTNAEPISWLDPPVIVTVLAILIGSILIPVLLHYFQGRRSKAQTILQFRKEAYTKYFKKYEKASEQSGQDYEEFTNITLQSEFGKLLESDSSDDSVIEFQNSIMGFTNRIQASFRKATSETTGLKIVGSSRIFELTGEFESLMKELLGLTNSYLEELNDKLANPEMPTPIASKMHQMGDKARLLNDEILKQMRIELGTGE